MKNPAKSRERKRLDDLGFVRDGHVWAAPECDVVFVATMTVHSIRYVIVIHQDCVTRRLRRQPDA
jgi:hypothetical protein